MKRLLTCCVVLLLLSMAVTVHADQPAATPESAEPAPLPGVAEIYPRLAKLTEEKSALDNQLNALANLDAINLTLTSLQQWQDQWTERENNMGPIQNWPLDNLQQSRTTLLGHKDKTTQLLDELFLRLAQIEALRGKWQDQKQFWQQWQKSFPTPSPLAPPEVFIQARQTIEQSLQQLEELSPPLVALQQKVTALQTRITQQIGQIEQLLAVSRVQLLARNQPSVFNPEFYRQFDSTLFSSIPAGLGKLDLLNSLFWKNRGGLVALHVFLVVFLVGMLRSRGKRLADEEDLLFALRHPFSASLFLSTIVLAPFYGHAPSGWILILTTGAVLSLVPLSVELFDSPRQRLVIRVLAYVYILSRILQSLSLPAPLYSLYLTGICLAGICVLWRIKNSSLQARPDRQHQFRNLLKLGMGLLGVSAMAQVGGYGNLAEHFIFAGLKTVFICLLAVLTLRLLHAALLTLAKLRMFKRQRFFRRHGQELQTRIWHLVPIAIMVYTALHLMVIWRLFDSVGEAWHTIVSTGIVLGDKTVSANMLLIALAALYTAILVSWLLRSLLEEEVFPRRQMDRGVRDSIKKLLHYAILAFGVVMALSLAGIELKNFAVLAGALGIGIGFGLQNIVNNFVSGLILLFERPIKIGDLVVLDNEWGTVRKIGLRSTTVETFDQSEVIVPNSLLVSEKVTNWTLSNEQCRIVVPVGVAYGSDVEKVLKILYSAAQTHPDVLDTPPPSAIFTAFGASSLDFELRVWAKSVAERLIIKNDLLLYIDRRFREEEIEIPFPQRDLHLRSVDATVLQEWNTSDQRKSSP
ncbi:MAG: mechanosensitive ion channel domain-containing protein [Pedobacter sp.]